MAENVEQIESQLAAYVDGELSSAEKLEIEKHLATNPTHRALIQDLMANKAMLQKLPSEPAPGDLTEGLQFQLEREVLLSSDPMEEARRVSLRINRLPQILSMAAVVLLTAGLGVVIYSVLPPRHPIAKIAPAEVPGDGGDADSFRGGDSDNPEVNGGGDARGGGANAETRAFRSLAKENGAEPDLDSAQFGAARMRGLPSAPSQGAVSGPGARPAAIADRANSGLFDLTTAPSRSPMPDDPAAAAFAGVPTVILTVDANDMGAAREKILAYFQANQIVWAEQGDGTESRLQRLAAVDSREEVKKTVDQVTASDGVLYERGAAQLSRAARLEEQARLLPENKDASLLKQAAELREQLGLKNEGAQGEAAAKPPAPAGASHTEPPVTDHRADAKTKLDDTATELAGGGRSSDQTQPIVLASLSSQQVEELKRALSASNQPASVRQVDRQSTTDELVREAFRDNPAGAIGHSVRTMASNGIASAPTTQSTTQPVAALSPAEAGLSAEPTTRPATTVDGDRFAFWGALSNGAIVPRTGQGLDVFNCVIVLKPKAPATQPTTQPAAQPAAQPSVPPVAEPSQAEPQPAPQPSN